MSEDPNKSPTNDRKIKLLRYGELVMRKARDEASPAEVAEMDEIRKGLRLSEAEIILEVETVVKNSY